MCVWGGECCLAPYKDIIERRVAPMLPTCTDESEGFGGFGLSASGSSRLLPTSVNLSTPPELVSSENRSEMSEAARVREGEGEMGGRA